MKTLFCFIALLSVSSVFADTEVNSTVEKVKLPKDLSRCTLFFQVKSGNAIERFAVNHVAAS